MKSIQHIKRYLSAFGCLLAISLSNITLAADETPDLTADIGYISIPHLPPGGDQINPIRYAALRESATSLGAQGGLAFEAHQLDHSLADLSIFLDQVFNFNQLLLNHNVLPPVLAQSDNNLNLANNDTLRIASKTYRIIQQAKFVTAPPNWRNYLWMSFDKPTTPDRSLLPTSKPEAEVWDYFLKIGWVNGIKQADAIFTSNLNQLKRDFNGMVLYRQLLVQKMVSAPFVAKAQLGITGDATQMRINDQVLRITAHSQLQTNSNKWQPVLTN